MKKFSDHGTADEAFMLIEILPLIQTQSSVIKQATHTPTHDLWHNIFCLNWLACSADFHLHGLRDFSTNIITLLWKFSWNIPQIHVQNELKGLLHIFLHRNRNKALKTLANIVLFGGRIMNCRSMNFVSYFSNSVIRKMQPWYSLPIMLLTQLETRQDKPNYLCLGKFRDGNTCLVWIEEETSLYKK